MSKRFRQDSRSDISIKNQLITLLKKDAILQKPSGDQPIVGTTSQTATDYNKLNEAFLSALTGLQSFVVPLQDRYEKMVESGTQQDVMYFRQQAYNFEAGLTQKFVRLTSILGSSKFSEFTKVQLEDISDNMEAIAGYKELLDQFNLYAEEDASAYDLQVKDLTNQMELLQRKYQTKLLDVGITQGIRASNLGSKTYLGGGLPRRFL